MTLLLYRFDFERRFLSAQVKASAAAGNSSKRRSPKKGAVAVDVDQLVQQLMALVGELQVALVANFPFGDATMRLQRALITALATDFGQLEMARQQWNAVMTNDACRFYAEMWMERLTFEQYGDMD